MQILSTFPFANLRSSLLTVLSVLYGFGGGTVGHSYSGNERDCGPCCHISVRLCADIACDTSLATLYSPGKISSLRKVAVYFLECVVPSSDELS